MSFPTMIGWNNAQLPTGGGTQCQIAKEKGLLLDFLEIIAKGRPTSLPWQKVPWALFLFWGYI